MIAKLFSYSLRNDELKWYFILPKRSIDKYEYLIHRFLQYFIYNIVEKVQFKDLYKIKQKPNQYLSEFVKKLKNIMFE